MESPQLSSSLGSESVKLEWFWTFEIENNFSFCSNPLMTSMFIMHLISGKFGFVFSLDKEVLLRDTPFLIIVSESRLNTYLFKNRYIVHSNVVQIISRGKLGPRTKAGLGALISIYWVLLSDWINVAIFKHSSIYLPSNVLQHWRPTQTEDC